MDQLELHVEALIFASDQPINLAEIKSVLEESMEVQLQDEEVAKAVQQLQEKYGSEAYALKPVKIAGGYQFMTKGAFHPTISVYLKQTTRKRLSRAALETLSIIAYKQPVSKSEMERIRGVSCDYSVQKLLEKELVTIVGRSDGPGRPLLYGTSEKFMDYFGLKSMKDLPQPKDFKEPENVIGEQAPIEELMNTEEE